MFEMAGTTDDKLLNLIVENMQIMNRMKRKLLLFDLDGTLLKNDKTISDNTLRVLRQCRGMRLMR